MQEADHSQIAFVAPRLVIDPIRLAVLSLQILLHGPGAGPRGRILDGDRVLERVGVTTRPALDEMQVLAGILEFEIRLEIGHVDDQGVTLPAAPRIPEGLADLRREMRSVCHWDDAVEALPLTDVVVNGDDARGLHDPPVSAHHRQPRTHAPLPRGSIFGTVGAVEVGEVVGRWGLVAPRRWRTVAAIGAVTQAIATRTGVLLEREVVLARGRAPLLDLWGQGREAAVRRIDDERRAPSRR